MALKGTGVIYLKREGFQIYITSYPSIVEFRFVPEIVRDLDIVNKDLLENIIKMFLQGNKLPPSNLTVVLADNAIFTKDFFPTENTLSQPEPENESTTTKLKVDPAIQVELQNQAKQFVEHIPFESIISKTVPFRNGIR